MKRVFHFILIMYTATFLSGIGAMFYVEGLTAGAYIMFAFTFLNLIMCTQILSDNSEFHRKRLIKALKSAVDMADSEYPKTDERYLEAMEWKKIIKESGGDGS